VRSSSVVAFRKTLPVLIDEDCVYRYHEIVESIEEAANLNLEDFKIDKSKISFTLTRSQTVGVYPPVARVQYSNKRYCDSDYFYQKLDRLQRYLSTAKKNGL